MCPKRYVPDLTPVHVNVTLFGNTVLADVICKLRWTHPGGGYTQNPMTGVFIRGRRVKFGYIDTDIQIRRPCTDRQNLK